MCGLRHGTPGVAFILELGCAEAVAAGVACQPDQ